MKSAGSSSRSYLLPIAIAVTLLVRIVYLLQFRQDPAFGLPMVDERWHWLWAQEIIDGPFWGEDAWFRAPLYPYFLALLHYLTDGSVLWARLLQVCVSGITALLLFRLGERLFDRSVAFATCLVYALYGPLVFYEAMFLIPIIFLPLLLWGMLRVIDHRDDPRPLPWLLTGFVFGWAAIARPNVLLFMPVLALWLYVRRTGWRFSPRGLTLPLVLAAGTIAAIAPVTVRNAIKTGDVILISSQGGINLYIGNNPDADGLTMLIPDVRLDEGVSWRQFVHVTRAAAERESGRALSAAEESSFWTAKARDFMISEPGAFARLVGRKLVYLFSGFENSDNTNIYHQRTKSSLLALLIWEGPLYFPFGLLAPLFFVSVWILRRRWRDLLPVYLFLLAYLPSIVLFLVTARHRLPLVPFMILIACGGIATLVRERRSITPRQWLLTGGAVCILVVLCNRNTGALGQESEFYIHFNAALQAERLGDVRTAEQEYLAAHAIIPRSAPLLNNLGFLQFQQGRLSEAESNYLAALQARPGYARVYNNLGLLEKQRGNLDSSAALFQLAIRNHNPDLAEPQELGMVQVNLAEVFERQGRAEEALALMNQALGESGARRQVLPRVASFHARLERFAVADSLFVEADRLGALRAADHFNWGVSRLRRGEFAAAETQMHAALALEARLVAAWYVLAVCKYESKSPDDSIRYYLDRTLALDPSHQQAAAMRRELGP